MAPTRLAVAIALLVGAGCSRPQDQRSSATIDSARVVQGLATQATPASWCIPRSEATLAGFGTFSPVESLAVLGPPVTRDTGSSEDDGGRYTITVLRFPQFRVDIDDRGYGIERIETTDPRIRMPPGVRVGMRLAEAQDRLRAPPLRRTLATWARDTTWTGDVCTEDSYPSETEGVWLYLSSDSTVVRIALTDYGP